MLQFTPINGGVSAKVFPKEACNYQFFIKKYIYNIYIYIVKDYL